MTSYLLLYATRPFRGTQARSMEQESKRPSPRWRFGLLPHEIAALNDR